MARSLRIVVASVGWTGHLYPALALARELRGRGHEMLVETFEERRELVEGLGLGFAAAAERIAFPGAPAPAGAPSLARAARELAPKLRGFRPDLVVADMWTLTPALAAEVAGIPRATLIPHPYPAHEPGLPFYPLGLQPARTPLGRAAWRALWPAVGTRLPNTRLRAVRAGIDATRAELGLPSLTRYDGQISERLALVATFPQLEYPRRWPAGAHVTGPMSFELPQTEIELPADRPLVLVAASTERDPEQRLARVALDALADEPVRVVVSLNRPGGRWSGPVPANAAVHDWVPYAQVMPRAAAVVCHGGHGTVARALAEGKPVLVAPRAGDQAENGARVAWAGAGLMLPQRLLGRGALRAAVRRLLGDPRPGRRAEAIAAWARTHDGAAAGAELVERAVDGEAVAA
ncbi:MAG TPA: nucleotide disphospho-sugar-binding domain-containing protein [Solirubrobacterales bacterium]